MINSKGGFTFTELYNLPVYLRSFYLNRLNKYYQEEAKEIKKETSKMKSSFSKK
tara:strand:+ start:13022 stop:13183 length:162 start_codon:yes stop_codon:yes gene_type:complete